MERDQAIKFMQDLLRAMVAKNGSDLFITAGYPPAFKIDGEVRPVSDKPLTPVQSSVIVRSIMNDKQTKAFDATKECNFAISPRGIGRFRVNAFVQQSHMGAVLRTITTDIPEFDKLGLPQVLKEVVLQNVVWLLLLARPVQVSQHHLLPCLITEIKTLMGISLL